jgi:hypothetical protein
MRRRFSLVFFLRARAVDEPLAGTLLAGTTEWVSVDGAGNQGNSGSTFRPAISADGRFVAFYSEATILCPATPTA